MVSITIIYIICVFAALEALVYGVLYFVSYPILKIDRLIGDKVLATTLIILAKAGACFLVTPILIIIHS